MNMLAKQFIWLWIVLLFCWVLIANGSRLRKKPKVYNALITTDENLTSSQAYPVIQPTIHESGFAHAPFSPYNPYTLLSPPFTTLGQPIVPGLPNNRAKLPYPLPASQFSPQIAPEQYPINTDLPEAEHQKGEPQHTPQHQNPTNLVEGKEMPKEQLPIPLNEYGLPPMLIRLPQQQMPTFHLPPHNFDQYPLIYDQQKQDPRQQMYLPPYNSIPEQTHSPKQRKVVSNVPSPTASKNPFPAPIFPPFHDIRNGAENKNADVPDVPPPLIPSGRNRTQ